MSARSIALFIHFLGVVTLFIAMGLVQRVGARIRSAATVEELRLWLSMVRTTRSMFPAAFVFLLVTGLYLANESFSFETPWVVVGIVALFVMAVLGGGVAGRGLAAIGKSSASAGSITPELALSIANPVIWAAAGAANGLALGILWLMVDKPGWGQSLGVAIALTLVGAGAGFAATKSKR